MKTIRHFLPILVLLLSLGYQAVADGHLEGDTTKRRNNKKERFTSAYPYENFGTKQKITLYATMENNNIIMAIENFSDDSARVKIKAMYDCMEQGKPLKQELVRTISVPANTTISYDNDKSLIMLTCDKQIIKWNITSWSVDKVPFMSERKLR